MLREEKRAERQFIEKLKDQLKRLEQVKQEMEEENRFLQQNLHRLIHEKVSLLQQIEELRQGRGEVFLPSPGSSSDLDFESSSGGSLGAYLEEQLLPRIYGLERKYVLAQKQVLQLQAKVKELEDEKELREAKLKEQEEVIQEWKERYQKLRHTLIHLQDGIYEALESIQQSLGLCPPLRKEEVSQGLPLPEEDLSSSYSPKLLQRFVQYLEQQQCSTVEPEPSPRSAIGYVYAAVRRWGQIPEGEEASFLEACVQKGLLEKKLSRRVHLCSHCFRYNLNFQKVCPRCHHGDYERRKGDEELFCPHCESTFEPTFWLSCLHCGKEFSLERAITCHLYTYRLVKKSTTSH